jgi:hypothetical protein
MEGMASKEGNTMEKKTNGVYKLIQQEAIESL